MDLSSAFKNEVFRPLMTLVVPGAVASAPYALLVRHYNPVVSDFLERQLIIVLAALAVVTLAAGFLIENIGSRIELWLHNRKADVSQRNETWRQYLALSFPIEPLGQRYLRTILLRMKFELHFSVALIASVSGWIWLQYVAGLWSHGAFIAFAATSLVIAAYLLWEANSSTDVLHRTRSNLVAHYYTANPVQKQTTS